MSRFQVALIASGFAVALLGGSAMAGGGGKVAVLNVEGDQTGQVEDALTSIVEDEHEVVSSHQFEKAADQAGVATLDTKGIAKVARKLAVAAVLESVLTRENDGYQLLVRVRTATGKTTKKLTVVMPSNKLTAKDKKSLGDRVLAALDDIDPHSGRAKDDVAMSEDDKAASSKRLKKLNGIGRGDDDASDGDGDVGDGAASADDDSASDDDRPRAKKQRKSAKQLRAEKAEAARQAKEEKAEKARLAKEEREEKARQAKEDREAARAAKADEERDGHADDDQARADGDADADRDSARASKSKARRGKDKDPDSDPGADVAADGDRRDHDGDRREHDGDRDREKVAVRDDDERASSRDDDDRPRRQHRDDEDVDDGVTAHASRRRSSDGPAAAVVEAGASVTGRTLSFTSRAFDQAPKGYKGPIVPGAHFAGAIYPLGLVSDRASLAAGLGLDFDFDKVLSLTTRTTDAMDIALPTTEQSYRVGVHYRYTFGHAATSPSVAVGVDYARRTFSVNRSALPVGVVLDIPDTDYKAIAPGFAARIPLGSRLALTGDARLLLFQSAGAIQTQDQYGAAKITGAEGGAGLEVSITSNVMLHVQGALTYIGYSFVGNGVNTNNRDGDPTTKDVGGALDQYLGGSATLGYVY